MSDHYSGNDPARGCGLMLLLAIGLWVIIFAVVISIWWLA